MKVAVQDANILIDLVEGGLLDAWFLLRIETLTTDLVMHEIGDPAQRAMLDAYVRSGSLQIIELDPAQLASAAVLLASGPRGLTIQDCSVVTLAREREAVLITGDALLRRHAESIGVTVHRTLWILDRLVADGALGARVASEKLRLLMGKDRRLPQDECLCRIRQWADPDWEAGA